MTPILLIDHYVTLSPIHGLGVFAAEPAPQGTVIWRFSPFMDLTIPKAILPTLPPHTARRIVERAEYRPSVDQYVLGADGDSYMNHSETPNFVVCGDFAAVAGRDIAIGDEITCDYRSNRVFMGFPVSLRTG